MPEWLKSLLAAVGGGTVVLVGVLTICKGLLIKLFETGIETSFEKNLEKFRNKLERSTRAYEILLDRETRFYEKLEPITAELIPLIHDLRFYLKHHEGAERKAECTQFKKHFERYCQLIITIKNENLVHQSYTPQEVFHAFASVVEQMQDDLKWWVDAGKLLFEGKYDKLDYETCDKMVDALLLRLAFAETMVRKRLKQLSGEE